MFKKLLLVTVIPFLFLFVFVTYTTSQSTAIIELIPDETGLGGSWYWVATPTARVNTPGPSQTPWIITATSEIGPSPTNTLEPTPTPEIVTPTPTIEPTPPPQEVCYVTTLTDLNYRDAPNGIRLGTWSRDTRLRASEVIYIFHPDGSSEEWALVTNEINLGWSAAYYRGNTYMEYDLGQACYDLRFTEPEGMVLGWFTVPGNNAMELINGIELSTTLGIPSGSHTYADLNMCIGVMEAGWPYSTCSWRHGYPDCPLPHVGDPRESARDFMKYDQVYAEGIFQNYPGQIYIDPINECDWGDTVEELSWWAAWLDEYITQAAARGWPPLHLPSLGPGYGDYLMFSTWRPALEKLAANGGMLAMHVYDPVEEPLCPYNIWLADRPKHNHNIILSLDYDIGIAITEVAPGWGNSPVNEEDFVCWLTRYNKDYPFVKQVYLWLHGNHVSWPLANLEGHVDSIIRKYAEAISP